MDEHAPRFELLRRVRVQLRLGAGAARDGVTAVGRRSDAVALDVHTRQRRREAAVETQVPRAADLREAALTLLDALRVVDHREASNHVATPVRRRRERVRVRRVPLIRAVARREYVRPPQRAVHRAHRRHAKLEISRRVCTRDRDRVRVRGRVVQHPHALRRLIAVGHNILLPEHAQRCITRPVVREGHHKGRATVDEEHGLAHIAR
eukprot:4439606-Prymnesium_polylepis.4